MPRPRSTPARATRRSGAEVDAGQPLAHGPERHTEDFLGGPFGRDRVVRLRGEGLVHVRDGCGGLLAQHGGERREEGVGVGRLVGHGPPGPGPERLGQVLPADLDSAAIHCVAEVAGADHADGAVRAGKGGSPPYGVVPVALLVPPRVLLTLGGEPAMGVLKDDHEATPNRRQGIEDRDRQGHLLPVRQSAWQHRPRPRAPGR